MAMTFEQVRDNLCALGRKMSTHHEQVTVKLSDLNEIADAIDAHLSAQRIPPSEMIGGGTCICLRCGVNRY